MLDLATFAAGMSLGALGMLGLIVAWAMADRACIEEERRDRERAWDVTEGSHPATRPPLVGFEADLRPRRLDGTPVKARRF